jgi:hypothetical protein
MKAPAAKIALPVLLLWSVVARDAVAPALAQDQPAAVLANPMAAQPLDKLSTTLDRPLFSPTRHPPAPPPPPVALAPPPPPPPPPPPNLVLFGVVIDGEGARAVVRNGADRKLLRAQIGDDIEGWKVSQIDGRKVVLSSLDGRFATFTLFSDDRAKAEAAAPPARGGEQNNPPRQTQAQQTAPQPAAPQSGQPRKRRRNRE